MFSDLALQHLGRKLLDKKYVLHMFELSEKSLLYYKTPFLAINTEKYAKKAKAVIQAEYNRAHISKAWWKLDKLPYILPNKPYDKNSIQVNSYINDKKARNVITQLRDKKIILYQGIVTKERPLEPFIKAIDSLGDDYALVVMTDSKNDYTHLDSKNLYFIPFITPPYHLEVTSHAFIGILTYVPTSNTGFSILNSIYCAPNKLYEYSKFGIPMIGNDIPGLRNVFEQFKSGEIFNDFSVDSIVSTIKEIENNYDGYSRGSFNLYNDTNISEILMEITKDKVHIIV